MALKSILFPTDFSEYSRTAMHFAFDLAERSNARVILLNSYELPYSDTVMTTSLIDIMRKNSEEQLAELKKELEARYPDLDIETRSSLNNTIRAIKNTAIKFEVDLIVMGTKGASGLQEVLIGSNTTTVLNNSDVPVLAIPENSTVKAIKKIVYAADFQKPEDKERLRFLCELASLIKAEILILHFQKADNLSGVNRKVIEDVFCDIKHSYHIEPEQDIEQGIHNFVEAKHADMVVMMKRKYGFIERLFHKSQTSKFAYHTTTPFLALHEA